LQFQAARIGWSTTSVAFGRLSRTAALNTVHMSIAAIRTPLRQLLLCLSIHARLVERAGS